MEDRDGQHCQHVGVARNGAGRITVCCECNVVHVELDCLTLRFTPASFRAVAQLLAHGDATLEQARHDARGAEGGAISGAVADGPRLH
ncbi:hypothetical protein [Massilia sp. DWR3-1-1]|uniref:hypothetical protein n=1 Tax=Massilia sp. DWR3-1-1 TaxID=2804559 RepID=UPI003CF37B59